MDEDGLAEMKVIVDRQLSSSLNSKSDNAKVNITFKDVSFSVKAGFWRGTKQILDGVHGDFRAGELTAIMGPSGAGKSSLMNALAGFITTGVTGNVRVNSVEREMRSFCRKSCYILQDDVLHPMLTVSEAMTVAAKLKLGVNYPHPETRIDKILHALGLKECSQVLTGKLSGGQRKRLAIALELINDPPVMFLDEPTSGLDISTSKQCVKLLKKIVQTGRTIICTIHQPSASLFEMFDHVYVLAAGKCIYAGAATALVPFLAEQQLSCPQYHNPADFLLEVAAMEEYLSDIPKLTRAIEEGRCCSWRKIPESLDASSSYEETSILERLDIKSHSDENISVDSAKFGNTFWIEVSTLILRNFTNLYRNQLPARIRMLIHVIVGIIIGASFSDIGNSAENTRANFGVMFFSIMFIMFTSYSSAVMYYPLELSMLLRENFNRWYSLKSYFIASNLSDAPVQFVCTMLYFTLVYVLTSQPLEIIRYVIASGTMVLMSLVGQSFGYFIGCSMNITNAAIVGPFVICPFVLFSGFFVLVTDATWKLQWLFHLSFVKYAFHAIMQGTYGFERDKLPCLLEYCHFRTPVIALKEMGMAGGDFLFDWAFLISTILLLRTLAYYALFIQVKYVRK